MLKTRVGVTSLGNDVVRAVLHVTDADGKDAGYEIGRAIYEETVL